MATGVMNDIQRVMREEENNPKFDQLGQRDSIPSCLPRHLPLGCSCYFGRGIYHQTEAMTKPSSSMSHLSLHTYTMHDQGRTKPMAITYTPQNDHMELRNIHIWNHFRLKTKWLSTP